MARAEEVMHQVEQRAEKMEKLRRELEELMQPVDGVAEARGRERSVASRCQLVEAIQQLGYLPRQGKNSTIEDKRLAVRLIRARTAGLLSSKQEAALGKLAEGTAEVGHMAGLQALHEAGLRPLPEAEARIAKAEELMQQAANAAQ